MRILPDCRKTISTLFLIVFVASTFCHADQKTVDVVGTVECADCQHKNIKHSHAVKGLKVTIDCKNANGEVKRRGAGKLDGEGKFRVVFPQELVENKKLKEECYAQLHSASNAPCPAHNGIETSKLAFVSESDGKQTFSPVAKLKFSPATCTSAFLWPHFNYPPLPKDKLTDPFHKSYSFPDPFHKKKFPDIFHKKKFPDIFHKKKFPDIFHKKPFPMITIPPITIPPKKPCPPLFHKPIPTPSPVYEPPVPVYKPPVPVYKPPVPVYKPPVPVYKPPVPVYKPPVPVYKPPVVPVKPPCPPKVPVYKPPVPVYKPPVPVYKPPVPVYKPPVPVYKPPVPVYKPPVPVYKPPVPVYKPPVPVYTKPPCPPLFKKPIPHLPPLSIPYHHHKWFDHPKYKFPPHKHPKFKLPHYEHPLFKKLHDHPFFKKVHDHPFFKKIHSLPHYPTHP